MDDNVPCKYQDFAQKSFVENADFCNFTFFRRSQYGGKVTFDDGSDSKIHKRFSVSFRIALIFPFMEQ